MARQTLTKTTAVSSGWPTDGVTVTFTAADTVNKSQFALTGKELVIARNSGASARTVTITSVSYLGRTGDITSDSIAAGATHIYGPFDLRGFRQADGMLYLEANNAEVLFAVITLP
jgi:hypothetical protein